MPRAMRRGAANAFSAAADREPRSQRTIKKKPVAIRATQRINSARTARLALPFSAPIGRPVSLFRSRQRLLAPWSSALQLRSRVWAREFSPPPPPPPPLFLSFSRSPLPPSPPPSHPPFSFFFSSTAWGRSWRNRARANDEEGGKKKRKKEPYAAARTERNAAPAHDFVTRPPTRALFPLHRSQIFSNLFIAFYRTSLLLPVLEIVTNFSPRLFRRFVFFRKFARKTAGFSYKSVCLPPLSLPPPPRFPTEDRTIRLGGS